MRVTDNDGAAPFECTLSKFLRDNIDGIWFDEAAHITKNMRAGKQYRGGIGGGGWFNIRRIA